MAVEWTVDKNLAESFNGFIFELIGFQWISDASKVFGIGLSEVRVRLRRFRPYDMQPQWRVREGDFQSVGGYDLESWKRILRALCTIASEDICLGFLKSSRTAAVPALPVS